MAPDTDRWAPRTSPELTWVVGRGGMLGQAVARRVDPGHTFAATKIDWGRRAADELTAAASALLAASPRWSVLWCAGVGITGTDAAQLRHETSLLEALLEALSGSSSGVLTLASSAGGVYGGSAATPITEQSPPAPISEYGRNKLRQERLVEQWSATSGNRAVIARIANIYGPGQHLAKSQGLVTQICRSTLLRTPVSVYVSLDTLRDYIYVDDCATVFMAAALKARDLEPGSVVTRIVASGASISIGGLFAEARRVLGRSPLVILSTSARASEQGSALAFRSLVWTDTDQGVRTPLPVGIHRTADSLRTLLRRGLLHPLAT